MNPEHSLHSRKVFLKDKLSPFSRALGCWAVLILAAGVFSIPFPFSRQIWVKEVLGITGIVNALIFVLIARQIEQASIPAALGGMGLVLNEQILAWRGFLHLFFHQAVQKKQVLFLSFSVLAALVLLDVFWSVFRTGMSFRHFLAEHESDSETPALSPLPGGLALFSFSAFGYLVFFGLVRGALLLEPAWQFAVLKSIASFASVFSLTAAGFEVSLYLGDGQRKFICMIKVLTHLFLLAALLWVIYRILPIESRIVLS